MCVGESFTYAIWKVGQRILIFTEENKKEGPDSKQSIQDASCNTYYSSKAFQREANFRSKVAGGLRHTLHWAHNPDRCICIYLLLEDYLEAEETGQNRTAPQGERVRAREKMAEQSGQANAGGANPGLKKTRPDRIEYANPVGARIPRPTITSDPAGSKQAATWNLGKEKMTACFGCSQFCHIRKYCPVTECAWAEACTGMSKVGEENHPGWVVEAKVNGQMKKALVDTGCSKTLVKELEGERLPEIAVIRCIHGDVKEYATTMAEVEVDGLKRDMEVGIVPGMTREMLLGRDWPGLSNLAKEPGEIGWAQEENEARELEVMNLSRDQIRSLQQDDAGLNNCLQQALAEGTTPEGEKRF